MKPKQEHYLSIIFPHSKPGLNKKECLQGQLLANETNVSPCATLFREI